MGAKENIYLFNSAYSPLYQRNVVNTLALPTGCVNLVRYTKERNVSSDFPSSLSKLRKRCRGLDGVFVFVDRYQGYLYYPIRRIEVTNVEEEGSKLYIYFKVREYLLCPDVKQFNSAFRSAVKDGPRLINDSPNSKNDGYYCVLGPDMIEPGFVNKDVDWADVVRQINTPLIKNKPFSYDDYLYARVGGIHDDSSRLLSPSLSNDRRRSHYTLRSGHRYSIRGTYVYLEQNIRQNYIEVVCKGNYLHFTDFTPRIPFSGNEDRFHFGFSVSKHPESADTTIEFQSDPNFLYPETKIGIRIKDPVSRGIVIVVMLIALALVDTLKGQNLSVVLSTVSDAIKGYDFALIWRKLSPFLLSFRWGPILIWYFILYLLFKIFGKRIL